MAANIFGNGTSGYNWVPNPTTRGSSNILQSCIITIGLAVWSAVHLNMKEDGNPTFLMLAHQTWRKMGWVLVSLLAPEMLVYTAWVQLLEAKRFVALYNSVYGLKSPLGYFSKGGSIHRLFLRLFRYHPGTSYPTEKPAPALPDGLASFIQVSDAKGRRAWTIRHGFYANMGGFALQSQAGNEDNIPKLQIRLDYDGLESLFMANYPTDSDFRDRACMLPEPTRGDLFENLDIPEEELTDKSNANSLAKFLVCTQALWFCIQCLARVSQRLPLSLLEANSAVHALSAVAAYVLWWEKPLDIDQPTVLPIDDMRKFSLCAPLVVRLDNCFECTDKPLATVWAPLLRILRIRRRYRAFRLNDQQIAIQHVNDDPRIYMRECYARLENEENIRGFFFRTGRTHGVWWPTGNTVDARYNRLHEVIDERAVGGPFHHDEWTISLPERCHHIGGKRASSWPEFNVRLPWVQPAFLLAAFLYGGLHCLAWNATFPSPILQILWRISCITIMAGDALILACVNLVRIVAIKEFGSRRVYTMWQKCLYLVVVRLITINEDKRMWLHRHLLDTEREHVYHWTHRLNSFFRTIINLVFIPLYLLARVYLIVGCFIQLFYLPPGPIYQQPAWSVYFPHFG